MFEYLAWIVQNQVEFILYGLLGGVLVAISLWTFRSGERIWRIADFIWISMGGLATFSAVLASIFLSDLEELSRRIDLARADLARFHVSAELLIFRRCNGDSFAVRIPIATENAEMICSAVNYLVQESEIENPLAQFVNSFEDNKQVNGPSEVVDEKFTALIGSIDAQIPDWRDLELSSAADVFTMKSVLSNTGVFGFENLRVNSRDSAEDLIQIGIFQEIGYEFIALDNDFEKIKTRFAELQLAWNENEKNRKLILVRAISLFFLAFVFPLRVGKSLFEIVKPRGKTTG